MPRPSESPREKARRDKAARDKAERDAKAKALADQRDQTAAAARAEQDAQARRRAEEAQRARPARDTGGFGAGNDTARAACSKPAPDVAPLPKPSASRVFAAPPSMPTSRSAGRYAKPTSARRNRLN